MHRRQDNTMLEHTGYLGKSRVVLNHYDVSTQADIQHFALSYESEDECRSRHNKRSTPHYSKQDIREQYCISDRGLGALEADSHSLFGCLSSHHNSPCTQRASFLTACVKQKAPSDENLYDLYRRHPAEFAPYPRRSRYPWAPLGPEIYYYDQELKSSYFRRKPFIDPSRYTWMPSDDESVRMEKPKSILEPSPIPSSGKKHVSFARSHTMASFDDAVSTLNSSSSHLNRMTRSQERLLDVRKTEGGPITRQPELSDNLLMMDKVKRASMKTQATQTEACLGRKPLPPSSINLSPRTMHRVKMVSQGAQTNGFLNNRKLIKSFSEAGTKFTKVSYDSQFEAIADHEPLHRTQSDEPPRSPFILASPPSLDLPTDSSSLSHSDHESDESDKKEIFIDFKPQVPAKRPLLKTASDGEILVEQRKIGQDKIVSYSHENLTTEEEQRSFTPYFRKSPIRHEGICKPLVDNVYSSFDETNLHGQDSIDEEFHENLIYNRIFGQEALNEEDVLPSPDESVVPQIRCLLPDQTLSPFASNDSLTNDMRDHSDGIWNESQATVLQVDSGTDNGTALSSSEMASVTSPGSAVLLTPSSRRRHLLMMQHQQRSSMDTEALDEEFIEQTDVAPRIVIEKPKKQQFLMPLSPAWRRKTPEPESPQPAIVPDLLARTDSGKTNTDVSESTTTDDYITANSGTDSSRKSGSTKGVDLHSLNAHLQDGSSFESTKGDAFNEDMVVPSFTSPVILDDTRSLSNTPVPQVRRTTGRSSPSDTSSSCGSYSVDGSCPDLINRSKVPSSTTKKSCVSEDEKHKAQQSLPEDRREIESFCRDLKEKRRSFTLDVTTKHQEHAIPSKSIVKKDTKLELKIENKQKRKARTKSPIKVHKKHYPTKKPSPIYSRLDMSKSNELKTSDESSCDFGQTSPRKTKKNKENNRRKSLSRSPTESKKRSSEPEKSVSLPGSLSGRRSKSPVNESPQKKSPDTTKLKATSAESLRSVSPGSDSVFYSDPSSHATDNQIHCLHCGKEVDIVTTDEPDKTNGIQEIVVQPPIGFEDSPRMKHSRLYKKQDRRFRSEDRNQTEYRRYRYRPDVRAKSEERGARTYRSKLRPMAKSSENSQEILKATDSSPSVLPGAPEDDEDQGIYNVPYLDGYWIYIDERDEVHKSTDQEVRHDSISSTESEQEFRKKYQAVTHRMVHRKSCLEMYKRQTSKSFECDKTVTVRRESGEFGFRIHGSKPVVVSAIEPGTPAESSGLEVGDIVLAVNGVSVLDKSHSEVVKIAHAGSDTLNLDVAQTCYVLSPEFERRSQPLFCGYLWKLSNDKWMRRWFCLKQNNCLYYYKTDSEKQPIGILTLFDQEVRRLPDQKDAKSHRFLIEKSDSLVGLCVAADNQIAQNRWIDAISAIINECQTIDEYLEETKRNLMQTPNFITKPDCFGYLVKLGNQWKSWSRRYCVLKDACLYFYQDINSKGAFGVAYLQGYRIQQALSGNKKNSFEIIPPNPEMRHYYFHTESESERKRWIAALEYSIDRWLKIN